VIVGIDASNLREGGGLTHLAGLLNLAAPHEHGISKILVWSGERTMARLPRRPWLSLVHEPWLDGATPARLLWQRARLPLLARRSCDLLFAPGGLVLGAFRPVVTMSRNLLPFDSRELARFGRSPTAVRLRLLRWGQARSYRSADGVIFLTQFARRTVSGIAGLSDQIGIVIPHGVDERFRSEPRAARPLEDCSAEHPFRILYVSVVNRYKHQWHVASAVASLRAQGLPLALDLVGPAERASLVRLKKTLRHVDAEQRFIRYLGPRPFHQLHQQYTQTDLFVFASSCENMPNILLEAMASGLPIASSQREPMPELLGDAGVYFDPESPPDIAAAIRRLIFDVASREQLARCAYEKAREYTWARCARETLSFLRETYVRAGELRASS
jgi:glycosyltransferase involved in cell wall biosynthesis